ncbi:MAG: TetR/AcrR family transcriptional regulator [Methyloligellaceae bacterium]
MSDTDASTIKYRQIINGARIVFLNQGFDAASMCEIARAAGVSKATLYVYFKSKEHLFETIFEEERRAQVERIFAFNHEDHDVRTVLTNLGCEFIQYLCKPERAAPIRTVISIAIRMPELGQQFYDAGPGTGIARVSAYLEAQIEAGILNVPDTEVAAAQLLDSFQSTMFKPMMYTNAPPPDEKRIRHVVDMAVNMFLAAYAQ